jgi:soluble lytic murein transglycosylase-like protein
MFNRLYRAMFAYTRQTASNSAAWMIFARDTVSGFVTTARHTMMVLGIAAIGALALMFVKPQIADHLKALSPFVAQAGDKAAEATDAASAETVQSAEAQVAQAPLPQKPAPAPAGKFAGDTKQQQWVTNWLAKRYRVASDATNMLVSAAYLTANEIKLDPLLILSVMAIESGFNPFAESPVGAQGLMQVMSKVHHDKFQQLGGVKAALNPVANIRVGSLILKDYVTRGGSVEAGLKLYVGAGASDSDAGYGAKVLAEYRRLKDVAMGKKVPVYSVNVAPAKPRLTDAKPANTEETVDDKAQPHNDQVAAL